MNLKDHIVHALSQLIHRVILFEAAPGFFAHPNGLVRVSPKVQDRLPHALGVTWLDKQSRLPVLKIGFCAG